MEVRRYVDKTAELGHFRDYLRFGSDDEPPKGERSIEAYLYTLGRFLAFLDGQAPSRETALAFVKQLLDKGNAPTSVNRHIAALKSWFRSQGQELKFRGLKTQEKITRWLDDGEWMKLIVTISEPLFNKERPDIARVKARKDRAILLLYCGAGLRLSEGCALLRTDIDDHGYIKAMGKGGREAGVPVEASVIQALKEYLKDRTDDNPYLFPGKGGKHISKSHMYHLIKDMGKRAGLEGFHPHTLRHTAATALHLMGVGDLDLQEFMRHRDPASTARYTHIVKEQLRSRLPPRFLGTTLPLDLGKEK